MTSRYTLTEVLCACTDVLCWKSCTLSCIACSTRKASGGAVTAQCLLGVGRRLYIGVAHHEASCGLTTAETSLLPFLENNWGLVAAGPILLS